MSKWLQTHEEFKNRFTRSIKEDDKICNREDFSENYWEKFKEYSNNEQKFPKRLKLGAKMESFPKILPNEFNKNFKN